MAVLQQVIRDVTNVKFCGSEPLEAMLTSKGGHPSVLRTLAFAWYLPPGALLGRKQRLLMTGVKGRCMRQHTVSCFLPCPHGSRSALEPG